MAAKYTDYRFCDEYLTKSETNEYRDIDIDHNQSQDSRYDAVERS